jgi:hypothetical protein
MDTVAVERADAGVLREIHRSMMDLWRRGYALPIRWTLASYGSPTAIVSGSTRRYRDGVQIATTTSDGLGVPSEFPLPARLVATDAKGLSVTGLMPFEPDQAA